MTIVEINRLYVKTRTPDSCTSVEYFGAFRDEVAKYYAAGYKPVKVEKNAAGAITAVLLVHAD